MKHSTSNAWIAAIAAFALAFGIAQWAQRAHHCEWVKGHDKENGEAMWINLAVSGSAQINSREDGVAHGTVVWAMNHAVVVKESPDELLAECGR